MTGAEVRLMALDRHDGTERLVARWIALDHDRHAVELAVERRALDGWRLKNRIVVSLAEIFSLHDAIDVACTLAGTVRK